MSVAVIGGGAAGLAAAWRLQRQGERAVLYEKRSEAGGLLRSDDLDGAKVDPAVQLFSSTYRALFRLAREAGASALLVRSDGRDALWRDDEAHTITYGSVASMAVSSALPLGLKLRLVAKYVPFLATRCRSLDANDPARSGGASLDNESIAAWGERELGSDFVEWMAYPFLGSYHGGVPERTSAAFYHALSRVGLDVRLYAVPGGVGRLARAIAAAFQREGGEIRSEHEVDDVAAESGVFVVQSGGRVQSHEGVIIACPAAVASRLSVVVAELREWLSHVESSRTMTLAIVTERPIRADWFGLAFPRVVAPGDRVVAVCVPAAKAEGLSRHDRGLLIVMPAPALAERLALSPDQAADLVLPALEIPFPGITNQVLHVKAYRHADGHTQFVPGYVKHLTRFDAQWLPERMALAGDYLVSPTVEGAVISGERAAQRVLKGLSNRAARE